MNEYDLAAGKPSSLDTHECPALTWRARADIALFMTMKDHITKKLTEAFAPQSLGVTDESHLHEGHAGHRPGGETHFRVYIVSNAFAGKSRVERHRMVNTLLAPELAGAVHALAISALAPGDAGLRQNAKS